jgi:hypothetical protein
LNSITSWLISRRLRRFPPLAPSRSVIPTLHQKHARSTRWVRLTDTEDELEETQSFFEFVMVYEDATAKFQKFMKHFLRQMPEGWDREFLAPEWTKPQVDAWLAEFFDREIDDIANTLDLDLIRIKLLMAPADATGGLQTDSISRSSVFAGTTWAKAVH